MIVRELITRLGFSADETRVRRFGRAVDGLRLGLIAGAAAMGALSGAAVRLVNETSRYGDELAKTADRLGITIDGLEQLRFAAERSGVSQQTLEMSLQRMTRRLSEAAQGAGEARGALQELGLDAEMMASMSPQDQLEAISDALAGVENQSDRVRLAMRFFDSEGVRLLNLVGGGSEEIRQLYEEFERLSGGLTEDQARAAEEFQDRLTDLNTAMQGLRLQIGARLMPAMQPLLVAFTDFIVANREIIGQRIAEFFDGVAGAAQNLTALATGLWEGMQPLIEAFNNLPEGVKLAAAALAFFMLPMGRLKGILIGGAILAVLEDIGAWMAGNESVIGDLIGPYEDFADAVERVVESLSGWETIIYTLLGLKLASWLLRVAAGARAVAAGLGLMGAGSAAAGGVGLMTRLGGLMRGIRAMAVAAWFNAMAGGLSNVAAAAARLVKFAGPLGVVMGILAPSELGDGSMQSEAGQRIEGMSDEEFRAAQEQAAAESQSMRADEVQRALPSENMEVLPQVDQTLQDLQRYLDQIDPTPSSGGPTPGDSSEAPVTNNTELNAPVSLSIVVPPGTTSEQVAFIESTVERVMAREINNAALALEA